MKKTAIFLSILAIAATAASVAIAQDAAVYSANTIGVIKYQIPAGGLTCIALPLNPLTDGEWVFGETDVAKQLAPGSEVFFWTGTGWKDYTKDLEDGSWGRAARTRVLKPGEAFFVRGYNQDQEIAMVGELPDEDSISYAVQGNDNLDARGVTPYPVEGTFGTTSISTNLPAGSEVFFWTGTGWKDYTKDLEDESWPKGARNRQYTVGEGIFIRPYGNVTNIVNDCPYDL